jgi:alginate O-acetyltransferase complex protein AlgI
MIFASFEFLFLFLPIFFVAYYLTPVRLRNWPILILSGGGWTSWRCWFA